MLTWNVRGWLVSGAEAIQLLRSTRADVFIATEPWCAARQLPTLGHALFHRAASRIPLAVWVRKVWRPSLVTAAEDGRWLLLFLDVPLAVYLLVVYGSASLEEERHQFWSAFDTVLPPILAAGLPLLIAGDFNMPLSIGLAPNVLRYRALWFERWLLQRGLAPIVAEGAAFAGHDLYQVDGVAASKSFQSRWSCSAQQLIDVSCGSDHQPILTVIETASPTVSWRPGRPPREELPVWNEIVALNLDVMPFHLKRGHLP